MDTQAQSIIYNLERRLEDTEALLNSVRNELEISREKYLLLHYELGDTKEELRQANAKLKDINNLEPWNGALIECVANANRNADRKYLIYENVQHIINGE
jgi:hypothetical protein